MSSPAVVGNRNVIPDFSLRTTWSPETRSLRRFLLRERNPNTDTVLVRVRALLLARITGFGRIRVAASLGLVSPVPRRKPDLQFVEFVPLSIGAVPLGDTPELCHPVARILMARRGFWRCWRCWGIISWRRFHSACFPCLVASVYPIQKIPSWLAASRPSIATKIIEFRKREVSQLKSVQTSRIGAGTLRRARAAA